MLFFITNLVKVMYMKKNTLSLAHLLIHISHAFLWIKSHCAHLLAPNVRIKKCYVYKQSCQCNEYKKVYSLKKLFCMDSSPHYFL